jgi:DNA-binding beta-propeller fold protein YncE
VIPINTATSTAGKAISVGKYDEPDGIVIAPDGTTAYVSGYGQDTVTPITLSNGKTGKPIGVGPYARGEAILPNGKTLYVANFGATTITPINTTNGKAGTAIKVTNVEGPIAIALKG